MTAQYTALCKKSDLIPRNVRRIADAPAEVFRDAANDHTVGAGGFAVVDGVAFFDRELEVWSFSVGEVEVLVVVVGVGVFVLAWWWSVPGVLVMHDLELVIITVVRIVSDTGRTQGAYLRSGPGWRAATPWWPQR